MVLTPVDIEVVLLDIGKLVPQLHFPSHRVNPLRRLMHGLPRSRVGRKGLISLMYRGDSVSDLIRQGCLGKHRQSFVQTSLVHSDSILMVKPHVLSDTH